MQNIALRQKQMKVAVFHPLKIGFNGWPPLRMDSIARFSICIVMAIFSCNHPEKMGQGNLPPAIVKKDSAVARFAIKEMANKKDPVCGMPLTAGIGDTLYYKGKVLGFCSAECKQEFIKDPPKYIAAAEPKNKSGK
jgi:YHS domain-containing protein